MDCHNYITVPPERKRGQHLGREERGAIQQLKKQGYSLRAIAREIKCSPSTILYELRRGTPLRKSHRGRAPEYSAKRGRAVYENNRLNCRRPHHIDRCSDFAAWVAKQVRTKKWSLDACVGYAKLHGRFALSEMVCTKTLYNEISSGNLPLSLFDLPEILKRKQRRKIPRQHKRLKGRSIDERPEIVALREEFGHWEADTVVGRKRGQEAVVLTLIERVTNQYLAIRIPGKNSVAVNHAMEELRAEYGDLFGKVFQSITADNGSEFEDFAKLEDWGTSIYFAHPYSSWERPVNERHNGLLRQYIPKGVSIEKYSPEEILFFADELNSRPRKRLGYRTPEELFEAFLDNLYAA
ncbi:IS30 family transposase [Pectinatus frisingensis]|jgi:IS30 family transposase|uniref:IS30 family transposase n=1 Tax=Pectinatus frisingensis TaxID=865 RepID=UPI0018C6060C|nr:IS30 family transposase [Pectinatus frisingensis]